MFAQLKKMDKKNKKQSSLKNITEQNKKEQKTQGFADKQINCLVQKIHDYTLLMNKNSLIPIQFNTENRIRKPDNGLFLKNQSTLPVQREVIKKGNKWVSDFSELEGQEFDTKEEGLEAEKNILIKRGELNESSEPEEEKVNTNSNNEWETILEFVEQLEMYEEWYTNGIKIIWDLAENEEKERIKNVVGFGIGENFRRVINFQYFLEAITPIHLGYDNVVKLFGEWSFHYQNPKYNFKKPFFDFIAGRNGQSIIGGENPRLVPYYNTESREEYRLTMSEKKVFKSDGNPLINDNIYVISPDKVFYGAPKEGEFHHSSFLEGTPVICAGHLFTDNEGKLEKIDNKSGHYGPDEEHLRNAVLILLELMDPTDVEVSCYGREPVSLAEFLKPEEKSDEEKEED